MINGPAKNIFSLLKEDLGIERPTIMVGHDVKLTGKVSHLVVMDAPLPGTIVFDRLRSDPRVWRFAFFMASVICRRGST
jgi:hypothetical protein